MTMLDALRGATAASHAQLDALFGALDLSDRPDFERFLIAHRIGLTPLQDSVERFAEEALHIDAPALAEMLDADLANMGVDADRLPRIAPNAALEPAAVAYVVAGSRLGLAVLRKQGYWSRDTAPSRYMEDPRGIELWRALIAWMDGRTPAPAEADALGLSAVRCFDIFREAFDLSETALVRQP